MNTIYKLKNVLFLALMLITGQQTIAQISQAETGPFLLKGGIIHQVTGGTRVGDVLISKGKIVDIANNLYTEIPNRLIDCSGKHIYPGMIDSGTRLGLGEVSSVSLTNDYNEIGDFIPHMQALTAINPSSVSIPVTRTNGVTTVLSVPSGGIFPGTAALINLYGYTPEEMYAGAKMVVCNFPSSGKRGRWDRRSEDDIKKQFDKAIGKLNDIWEKATLYAKIDSTATAQGKQPEGYNPEMKAMLPVMRGDMKLMINVNKKEDILKAIEWVKEKEINAVLSGVKEGWRVAKEIAEAGLPVLVGPILDNPSRNYDRYDVVYSNAGKMAEAGVLVAIKTNETENVRNLPFNAGFAAAYGMGKKAALEAVTINPAKIFGVDDQLGSIEKGKVANLFICDGDPFETKTTIEHLFIRGYKVPIESRHTQLYDEFISRGAKGEY